MTFEKNPSYFFEIIRKNNRIRNVINDCKTDNVDDIQDEKERDDVILYLKNRGCIFINRHSGYLKYTRNDIELSTDNKEDVFESIIILLNNTLKLEIKKQSCKYTEYYCKEHKIRNHECINVNEYIYNTDEDKYYRIDYLNYDIYNESVTIYNKYHNYFTNDTYNLDHEIYNFNTEHYLFYKPTIGKLIKKDGKFNYSEDKQKMIIPKKIRHKKYKQIYNINKLFFLSFREKRKNHYENVNCFLSKDEILDILDSIV